MPLKRDKSNKKPLFSKSKKRLDIAAQAAIGNLIFSKQEVWAFYKVAPEMFDFLSGEMQVNNASKISVALTSLVENRAEPLDVMFWTDSTPIDVDSWQAQVESVVDDWDGNTAAFNEFLSKMSDYLKVSDFTKRVAYIGINIGRRGALNIEDLNPLEAGARSAWESLMKWASQITKTFDGDVSADEEAFYRQRSMHYETILRNSALKAVPVTAEEMLLVIKRVMYPAMPTPYLSVDTKNRWGAGDLALETTSVIKNKFRWLEINQMFGATELTGYRATISLNKFPKRATFPYDAVPFLYIPQRLMGLPFTTYARVRLIPNAEMRKRINNKRKEQADQLNNMAAGQTKDEGSVAVEDHSSMQEDHSDLKTLDKETLANKAPWVEGSYRIVIEAVSEEALKNIVAAIKKTYAELQIGTVLSSGDQLDLFLEQMPGDNLRVKSFRQLTNLNHLATSGFNIYSSVGDKIWSKGEARERNGN